MKGNLAVSRSINIQYFLISTSAVQVMREQLPSQKGGKGKKKKKSPLLYKSLADHRLPHMEFDRGDKKRLILMMQRAQNWSKKDWKRKTKPLLPVFSRCFAFLLSVWRLGNGVVSHLIDVALILVILMMII